DEIRMILKWLKCSIPEDALHDILKEVDADQSGTINQREYLRCLRKVREHELDLVRKAIASAQDEGCLPRERVPHLFRDLGYILWDAEAITEAAQDAGILEHHLDLSNLWRLLLMYRHREGMRSSELECIDTAFRREDPEGTGRLSPLEVPTAIRSLGYQVSFEAMQSVLRQVDVDDSGHLDKMQFRKVIRMLQEIDP
ncbi:E3 ubiquitin-protein ligase SHPRH, partial [Durusdinium trenchii]